MQCQTTDTLGFPINIGPNLNNIQPNDLALLKGITETHDFSVSWSPPNIKVSYSDPSENQLDISAFNQDSLTLTYSNVIYKAEPRLSVLYNQHTKFTNATCECILAFTMPTSTRNSYPSLPDVILLSRPIIFSEKSSIGFWNNVNDKSDIPATNGISTLFTYEGNNNTILLPMVTYQTCIPIQYKISSSDNFSIGSLKVRVNVVQSPVYVSNSSSGIYQHFKSGGTTTYRFPKPSYYDTIQLTNNLPIATNPVGTSNIFKTIQASSPIASDVSTLITKIIILAPDVVLGQPFSALSISSVSKLKDATGIDLSADRSSSSKTNKRYQCYRFDPSQDIDSNNQILIDPTNGQRLENVMSNLKSAAAGGNTELLNGSAPDSGIRPGDIQQIAIILIALIGTSFLIMYLLYIFNLMISPPEQGLYGQVGKHIFGFCVILLALSITCIYLDSGTK